MKAVGRTQNDIDKRNAERIRRKRINPLSPPKTLDIRGVQVHFPFTPYACQETYMNKIIEALFKSENALLESPTGTGKTLCLLCSTLAWQREQSRLIQQSAELLSQNPILTNKTTTGIRKTPTIIYASRTHSQLTQVLKELRNTRYRPTHAVLGSREQMCVHPKVKTAQASASDINHNCSKLCKERKCRYRLGLENGFEAPANETQYAGQLETQPIRDIEDLVQMGKDHKVCPFYYTRSLVENAELVLMPYNYLFDKDARSTTLAGIPWDNAVVIFDEAHNLEGFASDSASFDLSSVDIAGCIAEVTRAINYLQAMPDYVGLKLDNLVMLKTVFLGLEEYLINLDDRNSALSGEFMMEFFKQGGKITHANHEILIEEIRKVNDLIMDMRGTGATRGSPKLEHFVQCIKRVYGHSLESRCLARARSYRVYVSPKKSPSSGADTGRTVSFWCFAPALAMEELANLNVRSILVTSGTLSPLPSYSMELGLPFPHRLENPHIITADQIHVQVVSKGVSGKLLNSSYERRQEADYYVELGNTLSSLARVIPAGLLVFFPSYGVMETCLERWGGPVQYNKSQKGGKENFFAARRRARTPKQFAFPQTPQYFANSTGPSTPWKRLLSVKAIVVEPKTSAELPEAMSEFQRLLALPKSPGCILMGVCRGKISEGIDFANEMSRAVVITGLPFPPAFDPKVKLKREYLDMARTSGKVVSKEHGGFGGDAKPNAIQKLSGHEWYTQQAHRAVNQAVGRVIRNRSDYGAVLLLDSRFEQAQNQAGLSKWLRPHVQPDKGFGPAIRSLAQFYKSAEQNFNQRREQEKKAAASVPITYEEEEPIVSKIALVKKDSYPKESSLERAYVAPGSLIAKMDMKDLADGKPNDQGPQKRPKENTSTGDTRPRQTSKFDKIYEQDPNTDSVANQKSVAAKFMSKIKTLLSLADQSSIRRSIVAMKASGQKKDVKQFHEHARDVVILICNNENFEASTLPREERMLFLFFDFLPRAHRKKVEAAAMHHVFTSSVFWKRCRSVLEETDSKRVCSVVTSFMTSLWCSGSARGSMTSGDFETTKLILNILYHKMEHQKALSVYPMLLRLLPHCYEKQIDALNNEIMSMVSACSKTVRGAAVVKSKGGYQRQDQQVPSMHLKEPPLSQSQIRNARKKRPVSETGTKVTDVVENPYFPKKLARGPSVASSKKSTLSSIVKKVNSCDVYVKPNPRDLQKLIASNAPETLTCPLCTDKCSEPYVAECGHIACLRAGRLGCSDPPHVPRVDRNLLPSNRWQRLSSPTTEIPPSRNFVTMTQSDATSGIRIFVLRASLW